MKSQKLFDELYELLQRPESIYEESVKNKLYRVFHFVKDMKDGKKLKVLLHTSRNKNSMTALQVRTMGYAEYEYKDGIFTKIW